MIIHKFDIKNIINNIGKITMVVLKSVKVLHYLLGHLNIYICLKAKIILFYNCPRKIKTCLMNGLEKLMLCYFLSQQSSHNQPSLASSIKYMRKWEIQQTL